MLRLPGGHVEDRTVDGSCNPYLAMAVILAAGLDGIEHDMDPGPHNDDNLYELTAKELKRRKIDEQPTYAALGSLAADIGHQVQAYGSLNKVPAAAVQLR